MIYIAILKKGKNEISVIIVKDIFFIHKSKVKKEF